MGLEYFLLGFATALIIIAALILVFYFRFKRAGRKNSNIKGYLDLIPDLSDEQRSKVQSIRKSFLPRVERIRQTSAGQSRPGRCAVFGDNGQGQSPFHRPGDFEVPGGTRTGSHRPHHKEKELLSPRQQRRFFDIILDQFAHGGLGVHDIRQKRKS